MTGEQNGVLDIFQRLKILSESVSEKYLNYEPFPEYKNVEVLGTIPEHLRPWYLLSDELSIGHHEVIGEEQIIRYNQNRSVMYLLYTAMTVHFPQLEQYGKHYVGEQWELIAVPTTIEDLFDSVYFASLTPTLMQ